MEDVQEYLKNRLMYPEKFFKVANSYYHSNKAWISIKNVEKIRQKSIEFFVGICAYGNDIFYL